MSTSKTKIPYGYHYLDEEDIEAVVDVLRKDPITQGSVVQEFGKALSSYSGAKYCVPVSSGTAALHLSLAALDIGPGAEVITTPLTFCATANVVLHQGANVRFVDVDQKTLNLDPSLLDEKVNKEVIASGLPASPGAASGKVTFKITRSKATDSDDDSESTVYINTANVTTSSSDINALSQYKVEFKAFQTSKNITVKTIKDDADEGKESFKVNLYKDVASATARDASKLAGSATGFIDDEWAPSYDYSITSDAGLSTTAKDEGKLVTFTVTRSSSGTQSKVFVSTLNKSALTGDDFEGFADKELVFNANQKVKTIEVQTKLDTWLESTEFFDLGLYKNAKTKEIVASSSAFIKDGDYKDDLFSITNDSTGGGDPDGISQSQNLNDLDLSINIEAIIIDLYLVIVFLFGLCL